MVQNVEQGKKRSPRHPAFGLGDAVALVKKLYERAGRNFVSRDLAATEIGFKSLHGQALTALATLSQYNLLDTKVGKVRVSDLAFTILRAPVDAPDRAKALNECLRAPAIFTSILEEYNDDMPADRVIHYWLEQKGFNRSSAQTVVNAFRETVSFIESEIPGYSGTDTIENTVYQDNAVPIKQETHDMGDPAAIPITPSVPTLWTFPLLNKTATVAISGKADQEDVDLLASLLNAFKAGLPKSLKPTDQEKENGKE